MFAESNPMQKQKTNLPTSGKNDIPTITGNSNNVYTRLSLLYRIHSFSVKGLFSLSIGASKNVIKHTITAAEVLNIIKSGMCTNFIITIKSN